MLSKRLRIVDTAPRAHPLEPVTWLASDGRRAERGSLGPEHAEPAFVLRSQGGHHDRPIVRVDQRDYLQGGWIHDRGVAATGIFPDQFALPGTPRTSRQENPSMIPIGIG